MKQSKVDRGRYIGVNLSNWTSTKTQRQSSQTNASPILSITPHLTPPLPFNSSSRWRGGRSSNFTVGNSDTIQISSLRAIFGDVTHLAAAIASLGTFVSEGTSVGCRAVARDVAEFTARVALHGLRLTVASIVVWSTALVACGGTRNITAVSTTKSAAESTTVTRVRGNTSARAVPSNVSRLATGIAAGGCAAKS